MLTTGREFSQADFEHESNPFKSIGVLHELSARHTEENA